MGFRAIEPVEITGLTSGPADFSSGWNIGINISNFTTIPEAATAVLLYVVNDSTSSRYVGIRHYETSNIALYSGFAGGRADNIIATLTSPSGYSFDFHTNFAPAIKFYIAGFFHDMSVLEPKNALTFSYSPATWSTSTMSTVPDGTKFIISNNGRGNSIFGNRWREVGGTIEYPVHGTSFIKIDANKQFQINLDSSGVGTIIGYGSGDWVQFVSNVASNSIANTTWSANNNWNDFPITYPNVTGIGLHLYTDGISGYDVNKSAFFRKKGSALSVARAGFTQGGFRVVGVDSTGTFQYWLEQSDAANTGSIAVSTYFTANVPDVRTSNKIKMYTRTV